MRYYARIAGLIIPILLYANAYAATVDVNDANYSPTATLQTSQEFTLWLKEFRREAKLKGIHDETLDAALSDVYEDLDVVRLDRNQPESSIAFTQYMKNVVTDLRVKKAREYYALHRTLLNEIARKYQVPAKYILALWGIESSFGAHTGGFNIINSLVTLAYEGRRADFFKEELIHALTIVQKQRINPKDMTGSWAGAMGHSQFMPSSYERFAVDYDGDGKKDIWTSLPDVFASIANYLHQSGWNANETWGRKVRLPKGFDNTLENIAEFRPLSQWSSLGVTAYDGSALPKADRMAALIFANRTSDSEGAYLIYPNYNVLLSWNKSRFFATAVGTFADQIY